MDSFSLPGREIIFRTASIKDLIKVKALSDLRLGKDYIPISSLEKTLNAPDSYFKVAFNDSGLAGFATGMILDEENALSILEENVSERVGLIKTVVVDERYAGMGVGVNLVKSLIEDLTKSLAKDNFSSFYSLAWVQNGEINAAEVLKYNGFEGFKVIYNYWHDESLIENYFCAQCGAPPCKCSAVVFKRV